MTRAGLCVLISLLFMAPLAARLYRTEGPASAEQKALSRRFVIPGACLPEPGERAAFLACALGLPALIFATTAIGRRLEGRWRPASPRVDTLAGLALIG